MVSLVHCTMHWALKTGYTFTVGFQILGLGSRVQDSRFRVQD